MYVSELQFSEPEIIPIDRLIMHYNYEWENGRNEWQEKKLFRLF